MSETQAHHISTSCRRAACLPWQSVSGPEISDAVLLERERHFKVCAQSQQTQPGMRRGFSQPGIRMSGTVRKFMIQVMDGESGEAVDDGPGKGGIRIQSAWSSNTFKWNEGNGFL